MTKPSARDYNRFLKFCLGLSENACEFQIFYKILRIFLRKNNEKLNLNLLGVILRAKSVYSQN